MAEPENSLSPTDYAALYRPVPAWRVWLIVVLVVCWCLVVAASSGPWWLAVVPSATVSWALTSPFSGQISAIDWRRSVAGINENMAAVMRQTAAAIEHYDDVREDLRALKEQLNRNRPDGGARPD